MFMLGTYVCPSHSFHKGTHSVIDCGRRCTACNRLHLPSHTPTAAGDPPPPTHTHRLWESASLKPLLCSNLALHSAAYRAVQGKMHAIVLVTYKNTASSLHLPQPPTLPVFMPDTVMLLILGTDRSHRQMEPLRKRRD